VLFKDILKPNASLLCMEFFVSETTVKPPGNVNLLESEWKKILEKNGFFITQEIPFYNPILFPSQSWKIYNSFPNSLLVMLKYFDFGKKILRNVARKILEKHNDVTHNKKSTFKIYVIQNLKN
jgi:hypothetical protein